MLLLGHRRILRLVESVVAKPVLAARLSSLKRLALEAAAQQQALEISGRRRVRKRRVGFGLYITSIAEVLYFSKLRSLSLSIHLDILAFFAGSRNPQSTDRNSDR